MYNVVARDAWNCCFTKMFVKEIGVWISMWFKLRNWCEYMSLRPEQFYNSSHPRFTIGSDRQLTNILMTVECLRVRNQREMAWILFDSDNQLQTAGIELDKTAGWQNCLIGKSRWSFGNCGIQVNRRHQLSKSQEISSWNICARSCNCACRLCDRLSTKTRL